MIFKIKFYINELKLLYLLNLIILLSQFNFIKCSKINNLRFARNVVPDLGSNTNNNNINVNQQYFNQISYSGN